VTDRRKTFARLLAVWNGDEALDELRSPVSPPTPRAFPRRAPIRRRRSLDAEATPADAGSCALGYGAMASSRSDRVEKNESRSSPGESELRRISENTSARPCARHAGGLAFDHGHCI
jgi:hypothetical protein